MKTEIDHSRSVPQQIEHMFTQFDTNVVSVVNDYANVWLVEVLEIHRENIEVIQENCDIDIGYIYPEGDYVGIVVET